jgi:hypothetical protein
MLKPGYDGNIIDDGKDDSDEPQNQSPKGVNPTFSKTATRFSKRLNTSNQEGQEQYLQQVKARTEGEQIANKERQTEMIRKAYGGSAPGSMYRRNDDGSYSVSTPNNPASGSTNASVADQGNTNRLGQFAARQDAPNSATAQIAGINPTPASPLQPSPATPSSSPIASATQSGGSTQGDSAVPAINPTWNPQTGHSWDTNNPQNVGTADRMKQAVAMTKQVKQGNGVDPSTNTYVGTTVGEPVDITNAVANNYLDKADEKNAGASTVRNAMTGLAGEGNLSLAGAKAMTGDIQNQQDQAKQLQRQANNTSSVQMTPYGVVESHNGAQGNSGLNNLLATNSVQTAAKDAGPAAMAAVNPTPPRQLNQSAVTSPSSVAKASTPKPEEEEEEPKSASNSAPSNGNG